MFFGQIGVSKTDGNMASNPTPWLIRMHQWIYDQWEFSRIQQMEVPTIYKAYVSEYHHKIWPYMVQYPKMGDLQDPTEGGTLVL